MGCFSSKQPTYTPPAPPKLPTAEELYAAGTNYAKTNSPLAYGAREGALTDLQDPTAYYSQFQPTSFEQALGNQSFQNIWPDQQAFMMNQLSKSGMSYSPVAAQTLGNAYGSLKTNIGEYLNTQANNRANQSLTARLGIDPNSMVQPYVQTGMGQGNAQASLDYGYQQALAQQQYQQAMNDYQSQQAKAKVLGMTGLAGLGYDATQGNLASGLSGTMDTVGMIAPFLAGGAGGAGGFASLFGGQGGNGSSGIFGSQSTPSYMNGGKTMGSALSVY